MRIERVRIANYRAFDELDLVLGEGDATPRLVALTGINGSGKTSVLRAIDFVASRNTFEPEHSRARVLGLPPRDSEKGSLVDVQLSFSAQEMSELIGMSGRIGLAPAEAKALTPAPSRCNLCVASAAQRAERLREGTLATPLSGRLLDATRSEPGWRVVYLPASRSVHTGPIQHIGGVSAPAAQTRLDAYGYADVKQYLVDSDHVRLKRGAAGPDPLEPFRALTRSLFVGKAFHDVTEDRRVLFRTDDGALVEFDDLSDGERSVLALFSSMVRSDLRHSVYLIDEPEQHLHPTWQARLPAVLREQAERLDSQYLLATHSVEVAEGVLAEGGVVFDLSPRVGAAAAASGAPS